MFGWNSYIVVREVIEYLTLLQILISICCVKFFIVFIHIILKINIFFVPSFHIMTYV